MEIPAWPRPTFSDSAGRAKAVCLTVRSRHVTLLPMQNASISSTARENAMKPTLGCTKDELDTPALCLDLDQMEANIKSVAGTCASRNVGWRPHTKFHVLVLCSLVSKY